MNYENELQLLTELVDCKDKIHSWLNDSFIDESDKQEIIHLIKNKDIFELRDRFYKDLEFGTGGIRGIMGAGFNRLNKYIVGRVTQGFANYILKCGSSFKQKGIAIAYDSRNNSEFFARQAALVLCANDIQVFLFPTLQTTPALSYAIRKLKCTGGLCFTASHNPPQYNGIKVYWDDGAQIISPQDKGVLQEVYAVSSFAQTKYISVELAKEKKLFNIISNNLLDNYFEDIKTLSVVEPSQKDFSVSIVFTPLHGTGKEPALRALNSWGFSNVFVVPEQAEPNGNFPTVKKPNPEEPEALSLAIEYANKRGAELVCATDPDSDRLALAVYAPVFANGILKHQSLNNYVLLNGNQTGALLIDHILHHMQSSKKLSPHHKVVKTIVTSELHERICQHYQVDIFNTLTGFKWISGLVRSWEESKNGHIYLFGTEESYGFMPGNFVRDKDGIASLCLGAEMAANLKYRKIGICDYLFGIFKKYGAWQEELLSIDLYGEEGLKRIQNLMSKMRKTPVMEWNGVKVNEIRDFTLPAAQTLYNIPYSDVLQFYLEDGSKISMRPSGTEPKLKCYISVCTKLNDVELAYKQTLEKIAKIKEQFLAFIK
ncbi:MAG: phospho-sugar mutase [Bdellovibrionota bacterium]